MDERNDYRKDYQKWVNAIPGILQEQKKEKPSVKDDLDQELGKHSDKLEKLKQEKLNMLIKRKYYENDETIEDENMFQFHFRDKGESYEFTMPLNILFGEKTQDYCAKFWDDFFAQADIKTSFKDNIKAALEQTGGIHLTMKINKGMSKEVGTPEAEGGAEAPSNPNAEEQE
jgi:hypothetical protein